MKGALKLLQKEKYGFTLLEVMITVVLGIILFAAVFEFFIYTSKTAGVSSKTFNETSELIRVARWITNDLYSAENIKIEVNDKLIITTSNSTVVYELENNMLMRREGILKRTVGEGITSIKFSTEEYDNGTLVYFWIKGLKKDVRTCVFAYTKK
jgi:prepilin-type N-terminal cleavage/methylation domain-containing protein